MGKSISVQRSWIYLGSGERDKREKLPIKRCVEMVMPIQESEYKSFGGESNAQERRVLFSVFPVFIG
ncbi:hypothetical protein QQP08_003485 [Theobroma cacao]|nr:hypothetical protein QQP08_003485 [Theobroma cacao]